MRREVRWSREALRSFNKQILYIARESPQGAYLVAKRLEAAANRLPDLSLGRAGRRVGTFEKYVPKTSHILAYKVTSTTLWILRVIHTSRDWRPGEWPQE